MPRTRAIAESLLDLLNKSSRPIYAIDGRRRITYCNDALATWLELEPKRIVGRLVEYHSEPPADGQNADTAPLADLCPPPRALAGESCTGTISCAIMGGSLIHRQANFTSLPAVADRRDQKTRRDAGVLVVLADRNLTPEELTAGANADPAAEELHRTIRRFRRLQAARYSLSATLGDSTAMQKVRAQIAAAAASGSNVLICGHPGTGRAHVGRAIHYSASGEARLKLVPVDCTHATDEILRRAIEALRPSDAEPRLRATLLLENLDVLHQGMQTQLLTAMKHSSFRARVIATCRNDTAPVPERERMAATDDSIQRRSYMDSALRDAISTITITMPRLRERIEDLPILAQCMLEACNRESACQIGGIRPETLDRLSLYSWPGELDELRGVIESAHVACGSHELGPADLPAVIHHAVSAAARPRKQSQRIVLDDLLARIEREAIVRALAEADGNKTEAAELLGMTRPRLYRRLVQLGLVTESKESGNELPEFIERAEDEAS
jgi:DNA-binding NtrC family response regulator